MTTNPKAARFFLRRVDRPATQAPATDLPFDNQDDGFGNFDFRQPLAADAPDGSPRALPPHGASQPPLPPSTPPAGGAAALVSPPYSDPDDAALAAIAAEGLTGKQFRRARLLAQKHRIEPKSDLDAVLQLRRLGIDPFMQSSMLEAVSPDAGQGPAAPAQGRELVRLPGDQAQLPQRVRPISVPSTEQRAEVNQAAEILQMQTEIARRRRRRLVLLAARMLVFVLLPTIMAGWYFYKIATPMYAIRAEFVIQQAGPANSGGSLGGLFSGMGIATSQDSIAVQGYLQSREAMARLEKDLGFREHFQQSNIDPLQRLAPDATLEAAYALYKRFVKISYDSSEGIVRMEVVAADPKVATAWAEQLIRYSEEQIDHLTQRLREDQMRDSQSGYDKAQSNLADSQLRLINLQEKYKIISSEAEVALLTSQISALESQIMQERLSLAQMESNETPNQARMEPIKRRIATLEDETALLRAKMTEGGAGETSLAEVQSQLMVAQSDLQTRQLIMAQALQSMETSRVEANRQVRYLSLAVTPTPTDAPAYPRAFENTLATLLIMLGIYLMVAMTAAILREQVSA
jgi:capsular polysaccharide transport system permease protein